MTFLRMMPHVLHLTTVSQEVRSKTSHAFEVLYSARKIERQIMIKILYVHGYNGKPNGGSFQKLSKYAGSVHFNGEEVEMHSFDYDESKWLPNICQI